jgi:hypothetical protein
VSMCAEGDGILDAYGAACCHTAHSTLEWMEQSIRSSIGEEACGDVVGYVDMQQLSSTPQVRREGRSNAGELDDQYGGGCMKTESKAAWQKHFRKIPHHVTTEIARIRGPIRVAAARYVGPVDVSNHLFVGLGLVFPEQLQRLDVIVVPDMTAGRYSSRNVNGDMVVRRDLPKITKSYSFDAPNFGDPSRGTHTIDLDREVYQRDYFAPREVTFSMKQTGLDDGGRYRIEFISTRVLDPERDGFNEELFFELNLLQENTGVSTVISASQCTVTDHTVEIVGRMRLTSDQERRVARDYLSVLTRLHRGPPIYVIGLGGTSRYVGVKLAPDLVVFENVHYGNAVYVIRGDWEALSKMSRTELLTGYSDTIDRVLHIGNDWEMKLQNVVKARMRDVGMRDD